MSKTAIISLHDDNYKPMADVVEPNFQEYADKWGYDLKIFRESLDPTRHTYWSKILAVKKMFEEGYATVFWCDIDSVFVDFTQDIVRDLRQYMFETASYPEEKPFPRCVINNMERPAKDSTECFYSVSQMLWSTYEYTIPLLDKIYSRTEFIGHIWPEQMAVIKTKEESHPNIILSKCFVKIVNPLEYMSRPQGFGGYPIATLCGGTGVLNQKISCLKKMLGYVKKS